MVLVAFLSIYVMLCFIVPGGFVTVTLLAAVFAPLLIVLWFVIEILVHAYRS